MVKTVVPTRGRLHYEPGSSTWLDLLDSWKMSTLELDVLPEPSHPWSAIWMDVLTTKRRGHTALLDDSLLGDSTGTLYLVRLVHE